MKHESTKSGSPRKSKMMWLLFTAPLLVPLGWFALRYYPQNVGISSYANKPGMPNPKPYTLLSAALVRHPYAKKFNIRTAAMTAFAINGDMTWLSYNRANLTLDEVTVTLSTAYTKSWDNVNERAIGLVAKAEQRQMTKGKYAPSVFIAAGILKQQGARNIKNEQN